MTNALTQALGLRPITDDSNKIVRKADAEIIEDDSSTELVPVDGQIDGSAEFEEAKKNIKDLIEIGKASTAELFEIAQQSQNSKDYEALTKMIKTMLEANREIVDIENVNLDIHEKKKRAKRSDSHNDSESVGTTHNTIVFTGTTQDILKQIEQLKKK